MRASDVLGREPMIHDVAVRQPSSSTRPAEEPSPRGLLNALPAAVYTCDAEGRVQLFNQAAVALWGRTPVVGEDLWCGSWRIYRPDGSPLPLDECPMAVTIREAGRSEASIIERPDGTRCHVLPHPEPLFDSQGTLTGAMNMLVDLTEYEHAKVALSEGEARLAAIIDSSDDAIVSKTLDGVIVEILRQAGAQVDATDNAREAAQIVRSVRPDAMICDIGIPDDDGITLIREIRAHRRSRPCIGVWLPPARIQARRATRARRVCCAIVPPRWVCRVGKPCVLPERARNIV